MQVQDVDLKLLRVFTAIVECGGLSAAEAKLNIGRSTISVHLADLEARLGVVLCTRGRAGFKLTEQGHAVYQSSLTLFQQCNVFVASIEDTKNSLTGTLSIAIIDMTINDDRMHLSDAIARTKSKGGHIQINLHIHTPDEVELSVLNGRSTIGIGVSRHPLSGLDYHPLYEERTFLYCGVGNPLFDCKKHQIKSLLSNTEFVSRGYMRGADHFGVDLPCKKTATAYQEEGIAHLILSGQYLGYLPEQFAQIWVNKGLMKAVDKSRYFYSTPIMLITKKNVPLTNLTSTFIEEIKRLH